MRRSVGLSIENECVNASNNENEAMKTMAMEKFAMFSSSGFTVLGFED